MKKPLTGTQIELIRLVMKPVSEAEVIREMQTIIEKFQAKGGKKGTIN